MLRIDLSFALALAVLGLGCSSDEGGTTPPAGGSGGKGGTTSSAGAGGSSAGSGGNGGASAGTTGTGGSQGGVSAGSGGAGGATSGGSSGSGGSGGGGGAATTLSFFVTSDTSETGDLGGLTGADTRCQTLAAAVGAGDRMWRAYLSVEMDPANANGPTHARDRIGDGPWYNANGVLLAQDLDALHMLTGDYELFVDENGDSINGQWEGSPEPNQHDILTGSDADGMVVPGATCGDWTSADENDAKQVGHSDGLGPGMNPDPPYSSWNSAHESGGCDDTAPAGGAGKIYCFAAD